MTREEKLIKLYDEIINSNVLTTKVLKNYGFSSHELTNFVASGILVRVKRGVYSFCDINRLYKYGKSIITTNPEKAVLCFEKCLELDSKSCDSAFQLFIWNIKKKNYEKALEYFDILYLNGKKENRHDYNLYLFLINVIVDIPDKYKEIVSNLTMKDIIVTPDDKRCKNILLANAIREKIFCNDFEYAKNLLGVLVNKNQEKNSLNYTIMTLLTRVISVSKYKKNLQIIASKNMTLELINNKNYTRIVEKLKEKAKSTKLSLKETYILTLANDIINIQESNIVPAKENIPTVNLFKAIDFKNYELALKISKDYSEKRGIDKNKNELYLLLVDINELVKNEQQIKTTKIDKNFQIINLIKMKKYEEITHLLNSMPSLLIREKYLLSLANDVLEIKRTGIIPCKQEIATNILSDAINAKDYKLALNLTIKYCESKNFKRENNYLYLILYDINKLIEDLASKRENCIKTSNELSQMDSTTESKSVITITDIFSNLMAKKTTDAMNNLHEYLVQINEEKYEILLINLIKLSILEEDIGYTRPMLVLSYLNKGKYHFDFSSYLGYFYEAIAENKFEEAQIYLNIIASVEKEKKLVDSLQQILNKTMLNDKTKVETLVEDKVEKPKDCQFSEQDKILTPKQSVTIKESDCDKEWLKKFLDPKIKKIIEKKDVMLLNVMDSEIISEIHKYIANIANVTSFTIGKLGNQQVVLKYQAPYEQLDLKKLGKEINKSFLDRDLSKNMKLNYCMLRHVKVPQPYVFAHLGLAYLKTENKKTAIQFLTIATKMDGSKFDFSEIIFNLQENIPEEDRKTKVKISLDEFAQDRFYGIPNIEEIFNLIIEEGSDISSACTMFNLNAEQVTIVKLILAREYYMDNFDKKGDALIKEVEQSQNKTDLIISILEEVKRNKQIYKNKASSRSLKL